MTVSLADNARIIEIDVTLPPLHPGQQVIADHPARFRIVVAGRRWGKTRLGAVLTLRAALHGQRAWWLAPTYAQATVAWRDLTRVAAQIAYQVGHVFPITIRNGDFSLEVPNGGAVQVRSTDVPDRLRGEGLDFVVFDEAATIPEITWTEVIRPALADRRGRALFIGTPKGRNWFWRLARFAEQHPDEWAVWQIPTVGHPLSNPYIDPQEVAMARTALPERTFRQEFLAEFVEDGGGVFRNVRALSTAPRQTTPHAHELYVIGVDWGKFEDFSVFCVLDVTCQAVAEVVRLNRLDYQFQVQTLTELCQRFRPHLVVVERNAAGEPLIEQLLRQGLPVLPFMTTQATKTVLIESLALALEQEALRLPSWPEAQWLLDELEAFTAHRTPSGTLSYGAPAGMHDDGVMALALAWSAVTQTGPLRYGPTIWG